MKKTLLTSVLLFALVFTFNTSSLAQSGDIEVGVGLVYGSEIEQPGITADGYYTINEQFRAGLGLTYFFPNDFPGGDVTWFAIDLNGNYIFHNEDKLMAYGLAGINIINASVDFDADGTDGSTSDSEMGLNIGAGIEYTLDFADLFGEIKYGGLGGDADQLAISAGLRFPIN